MSTTNAAEVKGNEKRSIGGKEAAKDADCQSLSTSLPSSYTRVKDCSFQMSESADHLATRQSIKNLPSLGGPGASVVGVVVGSVHRISGQYHLNAVFRIRLSHFFSNIMWYINGH